MLKYTIYHNPKCSKSKEALDILEKNDIQPTIINYLDVGFNEPELRNILNMLKLSEVVRTNQQEFSNNPFDLNSIDEVIQGLIIHPILFQRPVVIHNKKALICRPPEKVLTLIKD